MEQQEPDQPSPEQEPAGRPYLGDLPVPGRRRRTGWEVAGVVVAVAVGVLGLVAVAGAILFMVALNSWADNK